MTQKLLEPRLTADHFAQLAAGLKLTDSQGLFDEARALNKPITIEWLASFKNERFLKNSEGTLRPVNLPLSSFDQIVGLSELRGFYEQFLIPKLQANDPSCGQLYILCGPPGTGKTVIGGLPFKLATGWNLMEFLNLKNMYVGETERRQELALSITEAIAPGAGILCDEIESFGNRDSSFQGDNVTMNLMSRFLSWSSQERLRGQVMILGTCNMPQILDPALRSRAEIIPVLPLPCKLLPTLIQQYEQRITTENTIQPDDPRIQEACRLLFAKDASNRDIFILMSRAALMSPDGQIDPQLVLALSQDLISSSERYNTALAALTAITYTTFASLIPRYEEGEQPWWIEGIQDTKTGQIDVERLHERIEKLRTQINFNR